MKQITDEMANAALDATEFARNKATREWMRAALTAALPLIRGAVVEECAKVAMNRDVGDGYYIEIREAIAAAIRALKD